MLQAKLELRQSQSLIITPQLQQAIKLLQLSNLDLISFLEQEIEQNPLLDWDSADVSQSAGADETGEKPENAGEPFLAEDVAEKRSEDLKGHSAQISDGDYGDDPIPTTPASFENLSLHVPGGNGAVEGPGASFEDFTADQTTLSDHLRRQLHIALADPAQRLIGDHLIDLIDETGYLRGSLEDVADRLGAPLTTVETVLSAIQNCDPTGVGARSLAECLALQLKELNRFDPAMEALLDNLDRLGNHDYAALQRLCGVDQEDLTEMVAEIRALNPRPGTAFANAGVDAVVPDIIVGRDRTGAWQIQLNDDTLPRICVNHDFYASVKRQIRSESDRSYLQNCMTTANWLARSLDQRRQTMLKVAHEIVRQQENFLEQGVRGLRPLALKDVAERIGMHESTVSRVTSNKYMQTPRGTFELKYFFTSAIAAAGVGDAHSSEAVKHRIKELIDNEAPRRVLSDDKIVAILRDEGIDIARRTVAKYREALRIPSSVQRRRSKAAAAQCPLAEAGH